jgi:Ser/Thr protein kinase RdoA (MazF antagonist)
MTEAQMTRTARLADVLAHFGLDAGHVRLVRPGRVNRHWRVHAQGREYVLRRYVAGHYHRRTPEAIAWEHDALSDAYAAGWPVAAPIAYLQGRTLLPHNDAFYALFPYLPGRPAPLHSVRYRTIKGGLLGRLHRDMASVAAGQREGFGLVWELDVLARLCEFETFDAMLAKFGAEHPTLAAELRDQRFKSLRELSKLGYGDLPSGFLHWDFHHDNLLFSRGDFTGLLDFDSAHLDARAADIAASLVLECTEPPIYDAIDVNAARAFVSGYVAEAPLSERELCLIAPLIRACLIWFAVAVRMTQWAGGDERAVRSIARTTERRIPALDARWDAIEAAMQQAQAGS